MSEVRTFFFGDPWPSGVCDDGERVPTPVGEPCLLCDEPIEEEHQGSFMYAPVEARLRGRPVGVQRPVHRECSLRAVLGGIAHLRHSCSCYGGHDDPDAGLTYRESALLAWGWVQEHGTGYP